MLKLFEFWNRSAALTRDEACRSALDHAANLEPNLGAPVARFATNLPIDTDQGSPYDAITEYWINDATSPAAATEIANQHKPFVGARQLMIAEPVAHVDRGRRHTGVKSMFLVTRRPEMTHNEAVKYWRHKHVPLVMRTVGDHLIRYTTNVGLPMDLNGWPDECAPFDGVAELWLDLDLRSMQAFVDAVADTLLPDERAFIGTYRMFIADERVHRGADGPFPGDGPDPRT